MRRVRCGLLFAVGAVLLSTGCGPGPEALHDVSGTVTFDGKPVPAGLIFFDPDVTRGGSGRQGFANIKDGKFTTAENGRGVRPGPYRVRVLGFDGRAGDDAPMGQPLFNEYEVTKDVPAGPSELSIDVPRKGKP